MQLPKVTKPRTINDAETAEPWPMTIEEAHRIALDNSEFVRVIAFGAQGIQGAVRADLWQFPADTWRGQPRSDRDRPAQR